LQSCTKVLFRGQQLCLIQIPNVKSNRYWFSTQNVKRFLWVFKVGWLPGEGCGQLQQRRLRRPTPGVPPSGWSLNTSSGATLNPESQTFLAWTFRCTLIWNLKFKKNVKVRFQFFYSRFNSFFVFKTISWHKVKWFIIVTYLVAFSSIILNILE